MAFLPRERRPVEDAFRRHPKRSSAPREALADAIEPFLVSMRTRPEESGRNGYLRGPHWERIKAVKTYLADGRCEMCQETSDLETHHRRLAVGSYASVGMERLAHVSVLCSSCHVARHRKDGTWDRPF